MLILRTRPGAVIRLFEQALGTQAIYGTPEPDMQQRTIESLSREVGRLQRQIVRSKYTSRGATYCCGWSGERKRCCASSQTSPYPLITTRRSVT